MNASKVFAMLSFNYRKRNFGYMLSTDIKELNLLKNI